MICNKLIPIDKPYQYTNRHDIFGILGSMISGAINTTNTDNTNSANHSIHVMDNKYNAEQAGLNRQFQENLFKTSLNYNSAIEQRRRLEAAGLNPYLMMSGGSAGTASSLPSGSSASSASPIAMQTPNINLDTSGLSSDILNLTSSSKVAAETRNLSADTTSKEIQNKYLDVKLQEEINSLISNRLNSDEQRSLTAFQRASGLQLLGGQLQRQYIENQNLIQDRIESEARTTQIRYQAALTSAELSYLPQKVKSELALQAAQTYAARAAGQLSDKQAQLVVEQKTSEILRQYGIRASNSQQKYISSRLSWEADKAKWDAYHSKANSGADDLFKLVHGKNGYSSNGWFDMLEGLRRFVPFSSF